MAAPPALPPMVVTDQLIESTWANAVVNGLVETRTRHGVARSAANQALSPGVNSTITWASSIDTEGYVLNTIDTAPPAGLGGIYAVTLKLTMSPAPSAIVIPTLVIAGQAYSGAAAVQTDHVVTVAVQISPGQIVQAKVYNGGSLVNAAAYLTMTRVSW